MTTIVFRDGVLAADSRMVNCGWMLPGAGTKVIKTDDGFLAGGAGECCRTDPFLRWVQEGRKDKAPPLGDHSRGILIDPQGNVQIFEGDGWFTLPFAPFYAWGTGFPPALGALHMGATAIEAVRIAALVDPETGPPVQWVISDLSPIRS